MKYDLISRQALVEDFRRIARLQANAMVFVAADAWNSAADRIVDAPAVDAEPVRNGYWIPDNHAFGYYMRGYICSRCKQGSLEGGEFCHICGAKMGKVSKR